MKSNFKKIISLLLVVMMLALVMLQAVSCGTTPPDNPPSGDTPGGDNPGGDTPGNTDKPSMSNYTVQVKSYGGLPLSDVRLYIHEENNLNSSITARATTDKNGIATFELATSDSYYIELENYPLGYIADDLYKMDATGKSIMLMSKPIDPEEEEIWDVKKYELGDIIHDFTITDLDGVEHTVSDVLKEKSLLVLNFWYRGCSNCDAEFPYLSSAYDKYSDKMELFAINDYAGETLQDALNHKVVDKNGNVIETSFPKF
ncbi:MAG: redoxin domain-containing protein, partial [Clostridia bacterium]|nr:redoxin domain-containing protein [Clostridia bacterium]